MHACAHVHALQLRSKPKFMSFKFAHAAVVSYCRQFSKDAAALFVIPYRHSVIPSFRHLCTYIHYSYEARPYQGKHQLQAGQRCSGRVALIHVQNTRRPFDFIFECLNLTLIHLAPVYVAFTHSRHPGVQYNKTTIKEQVNTNTHPQ